MNNNKHTQVVDFSNPNADKIISGSTQAPMSNNKQTSVDQLFDQLSSENLLGLFTHDQMRRAIEMLEKAKAMHKEEIEDSFNYGQIDLGMEAEDYYEQTYGGNK